MKDGDSELAADVSKGSALVVATPSALSTELQREVDASKRKPRTKSTLRAYNLDWRRFTEWCSRANQRAFPASEDTIVAFLLAMSKVHMPGSLDRAYAAIRVVHELKGDLLPVQKGVVNALINIRRERASQGLPNVVKKRELGSEQVIAAAALFPDTLSGLRDRAVLLFGWALSQRRSDIAGVRIADLRFESWGIDVTFPRTKTNQEGKLFVVPVHRQEGPGCPVAAVQAWLKASGVKEGKLLRRIHKTGSVDPRGLSPSGVAAVVKAAVRSLGLNPKEFGGHSLRRGFITSASRAGVPMERIMAQTGHTDPKTVMGYIADTHRIERAAGIGLLSSPARETIEVRGQALVKTPKRRFERAGKPYDASGVKALLDQGRSKEQVAAALSKMGVTWAGRPVEARDL